MGRPKRQSNSTRFTVELSESAGMRLLVLQSAMDAASRSEVIRRSLAVMECLQAIKAKDGLVMLVDSDGSQRELLLEPGR